MWDQGHPHLTKCQMYCWLFLVGWLLGRRLAPLLRPQIIAWEVSHTGWLLLCSAPCAQQYAFDACSPFVLGLRSRPCGHMWQGLFGSTADPCVNCTVLSSLYHIHSLSGGGPRILFHGDVVHRGCLVQKLTHV